jgi:hypothetical protein
METELKALDNWQNEVRAAIAELIAQKKPEAEEQ